VGEVSEVGGSNRSLFKIFCFSYLTGVNLLIGTESGLMLLDRSGQNKGMSFLCVVHCVVYGFKDFQYHIETFGLVVICLFI